MQWKALIIYFGLIVFTLLMTCLLVMTSLMILTISPLKGFSLVSMCIIFIITFLIVLFFALRLFTRRRIKGLLYLSSAVVIIFLLGSFSANWVLQFQMNQLEKSFEKMGFPLAIEALKKVPEDSNAAPSYLKAINLLKDTESPKVLHVLHQSLGNTSLLSEDLKVLAGWVDDNRQAIESLDDIEQYPQFRYREYADYKDRLFALPLIRFIKVRRLAELLIADVIVNISDGNNDAAQMSFGKLIHLVSALRQEYNLIYSLVSISIAKEAFSLYGYELLRSRKPIISFDMINNLTDSSFIEKGLYGEALTVYYLRGKPTSGSVPLFGFDNFVKMFKREYLTLLRDIIRLCRERANYPDLQIKKLKASVLNLPEFPYGLFALPNFERFLQAEYEYRNTISLLHILSVLVKYKEEHGVFPENLQLLVDDNLSEALQNDVFSGKPFIYRMTGDKVMIYSVGTDMHDDGGSVNNNKDVGYLLTF